MLLWVINEAEIIVRRPLQQVLAFCVGTVIAPVRMVAVEVAHIDCWMEKGRQWAGDVPCLTWRFVDVGNRITADFDYIAVVCREVLSDIHEVAPHIGGSAMSGMQMITSEVKTPNSKAA